ncbi:MAG: hypothetical protein Q3976_08600 [Corynebacterium sp.]|nr:hypothetical protein [Corynebacterium sp.]
MATSSKKTGKKDQQLLSQRKQSRGWVITASAEKFSREDIIEALGDYAGVVGQLEEGKETGYRHWQLYVEHSSAIRFSTLQKKLPTAHLEPRCGSKAQAYEYCTKKDSRVPDELPVMVGRINVADNQGNRTDLQELQQRILDGNETFEDLLTDFDCPAWRYPSQVRFLVQARDTQRQRQEENQLRKLSMSYWWGAPGAGKTMRAWEETNGFHDTYRVTDYVHPFDNYAGQSTLVLDEFAGQIPLAELLNLLDVYPTELGARYSNKFARYTRVIIISNLAPAALFKNYEPARVQAFWRRVHSVEEIVAPPDKVLQQAVEVVQEQLL